jgi:hypothetical protein
MEAERRIVGVYGGDSERRRPFIAGGDTGRGEEKAREAVEKEWEDVREGVWQQCVEEAQRRPATISKSYFIMSKKSEKNIGVCT